MSEPLEPRGRPWTVVGIAILAALHGALAFDAGRRQTPTFDEVAHLPAGLSYLQTGTFKVYRLSPPLARIVAALPASLTAPPLDYEGTWQRHDPPSHWSFAFGAISKVRGKPELEARYLDAFNFGRAAMALWSATTVPILYCWGSWRLSPAAGWLAAVLWSLCPNVIAHAGIVGTDVPAASMAAWACFAFDLWLAKPTWRRTIFFGFALGLAQLVKFTLLWLYPVLATWMLIAAWRKSDRASIVGLFVVAVAASICTIDAGYLFRGIGFRMGKFPFACRLLTRERAQADGPPDHSWNPVRQQLLDRRVNRLRDTMFGALPCMLPYDYVAGLDEQLAEAEMVVPGYLRGRWFGGEANDLADRLAYYPSTLLYKLPIGTLALIGLGVIVSQMLSLAGRFATRLWLMLALIPIATTMIGTQSHLGIRYLLPALPFAFLATGCVVHDCTSRVRWVGIATALLVNVHSIARIHPHELSYFNELAGGPTGGRFWLIDSNLDWGQDLRRLSRWIKDHPDWQGVRLAYAGIVPAELEGLSALPAPRDIRAIDNSQLLPWENRKDPETFGPQPGKFAVSVNFERGMGFMTPLSVAVPDRKGGAMKQKLTSADPIVLRMPRYCWSYFQAFQPRIEPAVGYSILLYDLHLDEVNDARRKMGLAELPH